MIPCIVVAIFFLGFMSATYIPLYIIAGIVAPIILALIVFTTEITLHAIPFIALIVLFLIARSTMEEERARKAARIAAIEQERERKREAERRQAEAARRTQVPRRQPTEYPPGAVGWLLRVVDGIATAFSGSLDDREQGMNAVPVVVAAPVVQARRGAATARYVMTGRQLRC